MKKSLVPAVLVASLMFGSTVTPLFAAAYQGAAHDPFDYTAGTLINNVLTGGTGWNSTGDSGTANTTTWGSNGTGGNSAAARGITSPGLTYSSVGYLASSGNKASVNGSGIGRPLGQTVDAGTFYFSYLTTHDDSSARTLNVAFFNNTTEQFAFGQIGSNTADSGGNFAVLFPGTGGLITAASPVAYGQGITHLVIGRIDWDPVGNERIRLYLNPSDVTDETALVPYIDTAFANLTQITQFRMFAGTAQGAFPITSGSFDEFRFGSTFASVVPEPGTLALLAFGVGIIGGRLLRRRS